MESEVPRAVEMFPNVANCWPRGCLWNLCHFYLFFFPFQTAQLCICNVKTKSLGTVLKTLESWRHLLWIGWHWAHTAQKPDLVASKYELIMSFSGINVSFSPPQWRRGKSYSSKRLSQVQEICIFTHSKFRALMEMKWASPLVKRGGMTFPPRLDSCGGGWRYKKLMLVLVN